MMLRAVIYCRCSTEEEAQQNALQQQVAESRQCVRQKGWLLVGEYIEARSGTTTEKRSEYNRLFEDLRTDRFDIVQVKSQDRLMRNTKDWYLFIDRLVSNGKRLYLYLERKFYSADDALITGIKAILAEEFSKELSKKINNAHQHRQKDGRSFLLPSQTFGLQRNADGKFAPVEEEMEIIRIIFALSRDMGCTSIAHYLEENGYRNRNGDLVDPQAVRRILRNPIRCGMVVQNRKHFDFQTKKTVKVPESEWVIHRNAVPAAVSEEEWREANLAMDHRKVGGKSDINPDINSNINSNIDPNIDSNIDSDINSNINLKNSCPRGVNRGRYPLSGKIRCGICGSPYYRTRRGMSRSRKWVIEWKCRRYLQYGRNRADKKRDSARTVHIQPGKGCDNVHLEEEQLYQLLENMADRYGEIGSTVCFRRYTGKSVSDEKKVIAEKKMTERLLRFIQEVLDQEDGSSEIKKLERNIDKYDQQRGRLLDKLLSEVISDGDYKKRNQELTDKIKELTEKKETIQNYQENLQKNCRGNCQEAQTLAGQRLQVIRERLETNILRQARAAEMIDHICRIEVYGDKLRITSRLDQDPGIDAQMAKNVRMEENVQIVEDVQIEDDIQIAEDIQMAEGAQLTEDMRGLTEHSVAGAGTDRSGKGMQQEVKLAQKEVRLAQQEVRLAQQEVGSAQQEVGSAQQEASLVQWEVSLDKEFFYEGRKEAERERIMQYMRENPRITAKMIAEKEQVSVSAINARIRQLKQKGILAFAGRGGHGEWIVREGYGNK